MAAELVGGFIVSSPHLFSIARGAFERARKEAATERSHRSGDPVVSVVFAAAAVEAFTNELGELAQLYQAEPNALPLVRKLATVLKKADDDRCSPS